MSHYETIESIDEDILVQNVVANDLVYQTLYFKRMLIEFDDNGKNRSVRANMYIKKDSAIVVSVIPLMGIEVFRICLDKSNVRIIDRLNRKIIIADYKMVTDKFYVEMNYKIIESLLTNSVFSYPDNNPELLKNYTAYHKDTYYSLRSLNARKYDRASRRNSDVFLHEVNILPGIFRVFSNYLVNASAGLSMNVEYKNFVNLGSDKFPNQVIIKAKSAEQNYKLTFNFSEIDVDGTNSLNFRLPDKYEVTTF